MQGDLQQRGPSSWRIRVFVGRDDTGKKRSSSAPSAAKRGAQWVMARPVVEVDVGRHVAVAATSFGAVLARWLGVRSATVEATTLSVCCDHGAMSTVALAAPSVRGDTAVWQAAGRRSEGRWRLC